MKVLLAALALGLAILEVKAFVPSTPISRKALSLHSKNSEESAAPTAETLDRKKAGLVRTCTAGAKPSRGDVQKLVRDLERTAVEVGVGQDSATSGLLNGEWELLWSPEDETRSSPFFWAFRQAFPDSADQIFGITDAIPAPIKEVGPAIQRIDFNMAAQTGKFVSQVKVATLGGMATSIMTTRATITGTDGQDGLCLKIETTKPEDSTLVSTLLGPFGGVVNENAPPFPSGEALERVRPGASQVTLRTTFCDVGLRISRDGAREDDIYVWRRREFASYDFL